MCLYINICHWQLQNQYVEINGAFLVSCFKLTPDVIGLILQLRNNAIASLAISCSSSKLTAEKIKSSNYMFFDTVPGVKSLGSARILFHHLFNG